MNKSCCTPNNKMSLSIRLVFVLGGIFLWLLISSFDATKLLGSTNITDNVWIILLLGLVASVSTCLAVTGGIIIGYTEIASSKYPRRIQFWLHLGRVIGFVLFGGLLGIVGQKITYSLGFTAWLNIIISGILLLLALQILGLLPKRKRENGVFASGQDRIQRYSSYWRCSTLVGAMTFFVPCGFTQMVQIMALASGSLLEGALIMGMFAIGTLPGLILLGVGTSYAKTSHKKKFEGIVAFILIAFSLYSIQGSLALLGVSDMIRTTEQNSGVFVSDETQVITLSHDGMKLVPESTVLEAGMNYEIRITPEANGLGCMSSIALPSINKNVYPVEAGEEIIYVLQNPSPGTYTFVCSSMGMSQGKITIE